MDVNLEPKGSLEVFPSESGEASNLSAPVFFSEVGQFYMGFDELEDEEIARLLKKA